MVKADKQTFPFLELILEPVIHVTHVLKTGLYLDHREGAGPGELGEHGLEEEVQAVPEHSRPHPLDEAGHQAANKGGGELRTDRVKKVLRYSDDVVDAGLPLHNNKFKSHAPTGAQGVTLSVRPWGTSLSRVAQSSSFSIRFIIMTLG